MENYDGKFEDLDDVVSLRRERYDRPRGRRQQPMYRKSKAIDNKIGSIKLALPPF